MKKYKKLLLTLPTIALLSSLSFAQTPPTSNIEGLDAIINMLQNDETLNREATSDDIEKAMESAKMINEVIAQASSKIGAEENQEQLNALVEMLSKAKSNRILITPTL